MNELTQLAVVGTAKGRAALPSGAEQLDALSATYEGREVERALLLQAAADATYCLAGYVAEQGAALPPPAPSERRDECSPAAVRLISALLNVPPGQAAVDDDSARLLPPDRGIKTELVAVEALGLLAARGQRLPHALLPAAMNLKSAELRGALREVLGERGRWLGTLNPAWSWAGEDLQAGGGLPADAERIWEEGTPRQRLAVLASTRAVDPARARGWVADVWKAEKAEFRAELLAVLARQPAGDDEPLLEQALDDRSSAVRADAARALARIPGSALVQRALERVEPMLELVQAPPRGRLQSLVRSVLGGGSQAPVLQLALPQAFPKEWLRDMGGAKPPTGASEASWWLTELLALVPPQHWQQRWKLSPAEVVRLAQTVENEQLPLVEGWTRAAARHGARDWALPLWSFWSDHSLQNAEVGRKWSNMIPLLAKLFTQAELDRLFEDLLRRPQFILSRQLIRAMPQPWSVAFGNTYLELVRRQLPDRENYAWLSTASTAAHALPPACFDRALALEPLLEQPTFGAYHVVEMVNTIKLRKIVHEVIAS